MKLDEFKIQWQNETMEQFCTHLVQLSSQPATPKGQVLADSSGQNGFSHLALIQLVNDHFSQRLSVQFNAAQGQEILPKQIQASELKQRSQLVRDTLKEVLNLTVGQMKRHLDRNLITSEISLPVQLRGYDTLFLRTKITAAQVDCHWAIPLQHTTMILTSSLMFHNDGWEPKIQLIPQNEDDSTIEFF